MTTLQRTLLFLCAAAVIAAFLFVPTQGASSEGNGYMPVWVLSHSRLYHLNEAFLFGELIMIGVVGGILFLACKKDV